MEQRFDLLTTRPYSGLLPCNGLKKSIFQVKTPAPVVETQLMIDSGFI